MAKILIIDDEAKIRETLKAALERRGHETVTAPGYVEGRSYAKAGFDIIFLDIMLPDGNGMDLLNEIKVSRPDQTIVMISGQSDIEVAVSAIQMGAYDYIEKPLSLDRILVTIENAVKTNRLVSEKNRLASALYGDFIGQSPEIQKLKNDVTTAAPKTTRFLITGENGTGKELIAHMIHRHSGRNNGPFVAVNCAALPHELIESELFGHTKGAFTGAHKNRRGKFEEAGGGSLFLDEISEMPPAAQAKILRALESRKVTPVGSERDVTVDCHVIAATNKDLVTEIEAGRFREDLYYRLNVVELHLPALRERISDLPLLIEHFLAKFAQKSGTTTKQLTGDAIKLLSGYSFPGNVRELSNLLERVHIYVAGEKVSPGQIKPLLPAIQTGDFPILKDATNNFERDYINQALARCGGNVSRTARLLGIERSHLYKKMKKLGIDGSP